MKPEQIMHEQSRRDCWSRAYSGYITRMYAEHSLAIMYADNSLKEFDSKFAEPK